MARRMRFMTWCKKDPNDERKINYNFRTADGTQHIFTSENTVTFETLKRLREAWLESAELINEEWNVFLYEDKKKEQK